MNLSKFAVSSTAALIAAFSATAVCAQEIMYISSTTGFMLYRSGSQAVTAYWVGQGPIRGFTGYGLISQDGYCLTGRTGYRPLTWESCNSSDRSQRWGLATAAEGRTLRNELGWCADLQGNQNGPNVPVLAWNCSGSMNQQWRRHYAVNNVINEISDPYIRQTLLNRLSSLSAGQSSRITNQEAYAINATPTAQAIQRRGGRLIGMDGATIISSGSGGLIAAGGMN